MNFTAIDFETANEKRNSPCSLGLTVVKDGKIEEERYWLIRPQELRFASMNIMIHGIRPADVKNEPEFDELWPEIEPYLKDQLVIAHNAAFDLSVLRATLDAYQIPYPTFDYTCTMLMSKHYYQYLDNAKLNTVNDYLGYTFDHHNAAADATACANILLHIANELHTNEIEAISHATGVAIGSLYPGGYQRASSLRNYSISPSMYETQPKKKKQFMNELLVRGNYVAFTGPLRSLSRNEAIDMVYDLGGYYCSTVSKKTTLLVTNVTNPAALSLDQMSTKLRKAMQLIDKGSQIRIINEEELFRID